MNDLKYAVKVIASFLSGVSPFQMCESRLSDDMKMYAVDSNDDQYFWCVVFGNGRHLPVPILMDGVAGLLQNSALKFVAKFMPVRFDNAINQYHNTAHALGVECEYGTWSRYEHAHPEYA